MKAWMLGGLLLLALHLASPVQAHEQDTLVLTNAQGTVVAESDSQGNVTYEATYRPYGQQQTGAPQPGPGYTGHVNDPATGLVYMQARYYDPSIGRFLSVDPVGVGSGNIFNSNRYAYANNSPMIYEDPTGGFSESDACMGNMQCASGGGGKSTLTYISPPVLMGYSSWLKGTSLLSGEGGGGKGADESYDSGSSMWSKLRDAVHLKLGFALGFGFTEKAFGGKFSTGVGYSEGGEYSLNGKAKPYMEFTANVVRFEFGKYAYGLGANWNADLSVAPAHSEWSPVLGVERSKTSISNWEFGQEAKFGLVKIGWSVNTKEMWEALTNE